jgi:hypothetical protein
MDQKDELQTEELELNVCANRKARFYVRRARAFLSNASGSESLTDYRGDKPFHTMKQGESSLLQLRGPRVVVLNGRGVTLQKTIAIAESLKREVSNLAQDTRICWTSAEKMDSSSGTRKIVPERHLIPSIRIKLWSANFVQRNSQASDAAFSAQEPVPEQQRLHMLRFARAEL